MLTQRQEAFCVKYFTTKDPDGSYIAAGYSPKFADVNVHKLLKNTSIQQRMAELLGEVKSEAIAGEIERQEKLTELYRTETERKPTPKEIVMAIAEHNKMTRVYSDMPALLNDNRTVNIYVIDSEARELLSRVAERTKNAIKQGKDEGTQEAG